MQCSRVPGTRAASPTPRSKFPCYRSPAAQDRPQAQYVTHTDSYERSCGEPASRPCFSPGQHGEAHRSSNYDYCHQRRQILRCVLHTYTYATRPPHTDPETGDASAGAPCHSVASFQKRTLDRARRRCPENLETWKFKTWTLGRPMASDRPMKHETRSARRSRVHRLE